MEDDPFLLHWPHQDSSDAVGMDRAQLQLRAQVENEANCEGVFGSVLVEGKPGDDMYIVYIYI